MPRAVHARRAARRGAAPPHRAAAAAAAGAPRCAASAGAGSERRAPPGDGARRPTAMRAAGRTDHERYPRLECGPPALPWATMLRLHDTRTGQVEPVRPEIPGL